MISAYMKIIANKWLVIWTLCCPLWSFGQLKVMTFNVRYNNPDDAENRWDIRKEEVRELVLQKQPDILGLQEILPDQLDYLDKHLVSHDYFGFGRDGRGTNSEAAPVFYSNKLQLIRSETIWLSETPERVSRGWDAALNRIVTYVSLLHTESKDTLHVFNAHFDHQGTEARKMSAKLIVDKIEEYDLVHEKVIVLGDFNCLPSDAPYRTLTGKLDDSKSVCKSPTQGPEGTWNGFGTEDQFDDRIDYIFTKNLAVMSYQVVDDKRRNDLFISDHFPVLVKIE